MMTLSMPNNYWLFRIISKSQGLLIMKHMGDIFLYLKMIKVTCEIGRQMNLRFVEGRLGEASSFDLKHN